MIRIRHCIALLLAALALVSFVSAANASAATVELRHTAVGEILVDSQGFTLFMFTSDVKKMDHCVGIMGCTSVWPPLTVTEAPTAGPGVNPKKLKTITLPSGAHQVMYGSHPLYGYAGNTEPGQVGYIGAFEFGGYWYGLTAKGKKVM